MANAVLGVQQALFTYCRGSDRLDANLLRCAFAPDAVIDLGAIYRGGVNGFVETAMAFMGRMQATRHELSNVLVHAQACAKPSSCFIVDTRTSTQCERCWANL